MSATVTTQSAIDPRDAALTLAIGVLADRIRTLSREDLKDLADLGQAICTADNDEELHAALAGVHEILGQQNHQLAVRSLPEDDQMPIETRRWIEQVAGKIREHRRAAGMSQEQLAAASGLPQSHISRLENEKHSPSNKSLERIAAALNLPLSVFAPTRGTRS
jgi:ribosome-binding protein aMBF1 (putative translation factor)